MFGIDDIVQLIEKLYSPGLSHDVNQIQQTLQAIQKSPEGAALSAQLLGNSEYSPNVQYFGALTLTVQLNTNTDTYEKLLYLFKLNLVFLVKLCSLYISNPGAHSQSLVTIRKLMSNSSLVFIKLNELPANEACDVEIKTWTNPVNTLVYLLYRYKDVQEPNWLDVSNPQVHSIIKESVNYQVPYDALMQFMQLSFAHNRLLLLFTTIIVEDLTKLQAKRTSMANIYEIVHDHLYISTMALINTNLEKNIDSDSDTLYHCISSWISYISMARNVSPHGRMDLSELFKNLISLMCQPLDTESNIARSEKILSILTSVFANDPLLISYDIRSELEGLFLGATRSANVDTSRNAWMLGYMNYLVTNGLQDELKELAICIVDFLQINTLDVCNKLFTNVAASSNNMEQLQQYIKVLLQMTNFPLVPIAEEYFSVKMVDFWLDLSDCYTNLPSDTLTPEAPQLATDIFQQVIQIYLPKIGLMHKQKIHQENDEDAYLHEFDDFRSAVSDLTESFWTILGNEKLTNVLITSIGSSSDGEVDIFQVEAMSFLLNSLLADMTLSESPWLCDVIGSCGNFVKNILVLLTSGIDGLTRELRALVALDFVRTSSISLGTLAGYFQHDSSELGACIDTLFQSLEKCTSSSSEVDKPLNSKFEILIVKALVALCENCREQLKVYLMQFLNVFNTIVRYDSKISSYSIEQLARSVGYIIQSEISDGPSKQGDYIKQLVGLIYQQIKEVSLSSSLASEVQQDYIHCMLSCISELGSAFIQDQETDNAEFLAQLASFQDYWQQDPLQIRNTILQILDEVLSNPLFSKNSRFSEVACLIIGKTLTVPIDEPHFLRYSMSEIIEFSLKQLPRCDLTTSLPYFAYLLESLVNQFKSQLGPQDFDFIFERFFLAYYDQSIVNDPDLLQMTIHFVNHVLERQPALAIHSAHWTSFILPTFIKLLPAKEKFTIAAVSKFWTKMINNKRYTEADLLSTRQQIIELGPELVYQTMYGLYHTQRSDLNCYTDLVRALVGKFPIESKAWLEDILPRISPNNKAHQRFISKLSLTCGSRAASNAILEWWLECNTLPSLA